MNDTEAFYIYVGKADPPHGPWKFIPDTPEDMQQAINDGYTAGSTMAFAYEPEKGKPEPIRRGPLVLDFDSKHSPAGAISVAREFIDKLVERYQFPSQCLRYWVSGGKGCHIEIPPALYDGEAGHPELPLIHKNMLVLLGILNYHNPKFCKTFDLSMYCMGKGKLLRWPNIKRPNDHYKVPVSVEEFFNLDYSELERLTYAPRTDFDPGTKEPVKSPHLAEIYDIAVRSRRRDSNGFNPVSGIEALFDCAFIAHCFENQATLPEPHWWAMISILTTFGDFGREAIHLFSRDYPGYNFEETEKKISCQKSGHKSLTCDYIKSLGFDCGKACGIRSPADLWKYKKSEETRRAMNFIHKEDGLYRQSENGDGEPVRVCSPLKVLGKMRNPEGTGWARLVEITTSDGRKKVICVYMRDMKGRGEGLIGQLLDNGLEINQGHKTHQYLTEYIMNGAPTDLPLLYVQRIGWVGGTYILPDASFGGQLDEKIYFLDKGTENLHQAAGTLDEWKEHVGRYCRGNSLLELLVSYALTGPLLRLVNLEGGGIHVFGDSATGKSTLAMVVGSICGGGGPRGYILQWRATDNALELVATLHNDNLLILDEISQASADTVSKITYMLANGQGKGRMQADGSRRPLYTWVLNLLSTGELTINDKIQESGKYTTLAGQEVRVIDLPIGGLETENTFQELHGLPDGGKLSELLSANACRYYGTPFRSFMAALCSDLEPNIAIIKREMDAFVAEYCPADASGQVKRVARKISLPVAVGELAISFRVLPFEVGAVKKAGGDWLKIWIKSREGHGNLETIKASKCLKDYIAKFAGTSRFIDLDSPPPYPPHSVDGYTWKVGDERWYLLLTQTFNELTKYANRKEVLEYFDKIGGLAHTSKGKIKTCQWVNGRNVSGVVLIPSAWEGKPDPEEIEEERQRVLRNVEDIFD